MGIFRKGSLGVLGRIIGLAATYALLLNLILTGLLGAQNAMAAGHGEAGFELCLSNTDGSQPSADGVTHAAKVHCILCVAGGAVGATPEPAAAVGVSFTVSPVVVAPSQTDTAFSSVDHRSTSQRGPPQQA